MTRKQFERAMISAPLLALAGLVLGGWLVSDRGPLRRFGAWAYDRGFLRGLAARPPAPPARCGKVESANGFGPCVYRAGAENHPRMRHSDRPWHFDAEGYGWPVGGDR